MNSTEFHTGLHDALYSDLLQGERFLTVRDRAAITQTTTLTGIAEEMLQDDPALCERVSHERQILQIVSGYFEQGSEMPTVSLSQELREYAGNIPSPRLRARLMQLMEKF